MSKIGKPRTANGLASFCARMAQEKKADDILILNLKSIDTAPADYFVVCSCDSDIQMKSIADSISRKCRELQMDRPKIEGMDSNYWILLDFFDVILHIMIKDARNFYKLEKLWGDAKFKLLDDDSKLKAFNTKDLKYD